MSTYIIGHKSPDLDSVAAAISYANFKNKITGTNDYIPAIAGTANPVTEFVLNKFGFDKPEELSDAGGKKIILVDHNEQSQQVEGEEKQIVEILDHHKVNFSGPEPIRFEVQPLGSTNSIIFKKYQEAGIPIGEKLAGLMLSALLDDTVITKSPTCTEEDKAIIAELAKLAGIEDWQAYGIEMFKAKADVGAMSEQDIIRLDFKDFEMKAGKIGISQVETVDLSDFESRQEDLLAALKDLRQAGGYHTVVLFITDILKEGSKFLVATADREKVEEVLGSKLENDQVYIDGIISRKKQVAPKFTEVFDK